MNPHSTLVLICKRPLLGQGKQRLAATLGGEAALRIAEALLACAREDLMAWPGPLVIAPAAAIDNQWANSLLPNALVVAQGAGNLGERLQRVDSKLRCAGHTRCLYIGSDAPALTTIDYQNAARALLEHDIVLTPARDGGVTLMGNCRAWPALADLPWSTPQLGAALARRCSAAHLSVTRLGESFDIDEAADLTLCRDALSDDRRPARQALLHLLRSLPLLPESNRVESV